MAAQFAYGVSLLATAWIRLLVLDFSDCVSYESCGELIAFAMSLKKRVIHIFEIIVGSDFFYGRKSECFTCTFYCQTENGAFPDVEWTDFALTVLSWWGDAVGEAIYVKERKFKLFFEDGPFWIDVTKRDEAVRLHFNTDRRGISVIPDVQMSFRDLAEVVEKAMRSLSSALYLTGRAEDARKAAEQAAYLRRRIS